MIINWIRHIKTESDIFLYRTVSNRFSALDRGHISVYNGFNFPSNRIVRILFAVAIRGYAALAATPPHCQGQGGMCRPCISICCQTWVRRRTEPKYKAVVFVGYRTQVRSGQAWQKKKVVASSPCNSTTKTQASVQSEVAWAVNRKGHTACVHMYMYAMVSWLTFGCIGTHKWDGWTRHNANLSGCISQYFNRLFHRRPRSRHRVLACFRGTVYVSCQL